MLHAYNFTFPSTTTIADAARKRLLETSSQKIEFDADFLDLARVSDSQHEQRTAEFLRNKYALTPPDLVMTLGSSALPFILKYRDTIAPKIPVVFTSISAHNYAAQRLPPDVTGIITSSISTRRLRWRNGFNPSRGACSSLPEAGATDRLWHPVARNAIEHRERKFETTYLFGLPYEKLVSELSRVP